MIIGPSPLTASAYPSPGAQSIGTLSTMAQAPMPPWRTEEEAEDYRNNPKEFLLDRCKMWVKNCEVFHNWLILATYFLPHKIGTGAVTLFLPDSVHDEALYQGKIGLLVAKGPLAFRSDERIDFQNQNVEIGDWLQYDIMEGRQFTVDRVHCRRLKDTQVVMRVTDPRLVY